MAAALAMARVKLQWAAAGLAGRDWTLYAHVLSATRLTGPWLPSGPLGVNGPASYLQEHFAPTLFVLVPLYRLFHDPRLLLWLQALAVAGAALPLAGAALAAGASRGAALTAGLAWLLHPWIWSSGLDLPQLFHHDSLLPVLAFGAAWAWWSRKEGWAWLLLALALGLKEDLPPCGLILALGLWKNGRKGPSLALAGLCAALLAPVLLPAALGQAGRHTAMVLGSGFHGSAGEMLSLTLWWAPIFALGGGWLAPGWYLLSVPVWLLHLETGFVPQLWHAWPMLTAAGLAMASGMGPWRARLGRRASVLAVAWLVSLAGWTLANLPLGGFRPFGRPPLDRSAAAILLAEVPQPACVAASDALLPLVADRPSFLWMSQVKDADFALVDMDRLEQDRPGLEALANLEKGRRLKVIGIRQNFRLIKIVEAE